MRVDVQLDDSELALLSGYNRSTTMGIKKPGELQRELLSDMENIEEKREAKAIPEEQGNKQGSDVDTVEPKEVVSASEDKVEAKSAPVRVRSDFLSMLSAMAQPNTHEDKDSEGEGEDAGILPEDTGNEEDESVLPDDDEDEDGSVLPDDDEDEDMGILPEDEDEEDGSVLPDDDEDVSTLPADDDEYTEDNGILPADDEDIESVAPEESTAGILEQQEDEDDGYSSELPEDDEDEEYSSELPADEEDSSELPSDEEDSAELPEDEYDEEDSSELPADEDDDEDEYSVLPDDEDGEEDASVLPDDEDEESSVLPEDNEEVEDDPTPAGIQETTSTVSNVVEHPVSSSPKVQKPVHHVTHQPTAHPAGYSTPSVPLYDFILNNGGSMLIEDVRKYYPIDEVKKALSLGKIYRFGNHVGV